MTWGAPGPYENVGDSDRGSGMPLTGLADGGADRPPVIYTRRDTRGRGHAVLCSKGAVRAALPVLPRGRRIEAASVNGSYVVWRQSAPGPRATIVRARVRSARLRDVRRMRVPQPDSGSASDHRIVAHANGTVAWALQATASDGVETRAWVWPRTGPVHRLPVYWKFGGDLIRVVDDQHILGDDAVQPLRYAPPAPGRCPRPTDASWHELAGWQAVAVSGSASYGDGGGGAQSWHVVCDPQTGAYVGVARSSTTSFKGESDSTTTAHLVRSGRWLLIDREVAGYRDRTTAIDTGTGRSYEAPGALGAPGIDRPPLPGMTPRAVAAYARPGAVAFVASPQSPTSGPDTLHLDDASGFRAVTEVPSAPGTLEGITDLSIDDQTMRWTASGQTGTAPSTPSHGPFGVVSTKFGGLRVRSTGGRR